MYEHPAQRLNTFGQLLIDFLNWESYLETGDSQQKHAAKWKLNFSLSNNLWFIDFEKCVIFTKWRPPDLEVYQAHIPTVLFISPQSTEQTSNFSHLHGN